MKDLESVAGIEPEEYLDLSPTEQEKFRSRLIDKVLDIPDDRESDRLMSEMERRYPSQAKQHADAQTRPPKQYALPEPDFSQAANAAIDKAERKSELHWEAAQFKYGRMTGMPHELQQMSAAERQQFLEEV